MSFEVTFTSRAERQLTRLWLEHANREAVTAAMIRLEGLLSSHPRTVGESRSDEFRRVLFDPRVGISYWVHQQRDAVLVTNIWLVKRRSE